jgi:FkbM family methyltransferase
MKAFSGWSQKLGLYLRAVRETKSINWRGLPLIPKTLSPGLPYNRAAYNEFLLWIRQSSRLREARIIFDVGANHGVFAQAASTCFPDATIFLFEPLPALRRYLESQARRHGNHWRFHPLALGASNGRLPFHIDPADDTIGSLTGFSKSYIQLAGARDTMIVDVPIATLDNFCQREEIKQIDLIKIDVEGFEFAVLDGASEMLSNTTAIIIETSLIRTAEGKPAPLLEMVSRLTRYGFYIVGLFPSFAPGAKEQGRPQEYNIIARRFDS